MLGGVALLLKGLVLWSLAGHPLLEPRGQLDTAYYVEAARQMASGAWAGGDRTFFVSPLYLYFLAAVFTLTNGSLLMARVLQVVLGAAAVALVAATARRWGGPLAAWVAGALCLLTGTITFNEILLVQGALDPFLGAAGLFLLTRAWQAGHRSALWAAGFALGAHVLNRPNMLAWAGAAGALTAWPVWRRKTIGPRGLSAAALVVLGVATAVAPVTLRNYVVAGEFALVSSHGGLNFYIGNNPEADGTYHAVEGITPSITGQDRDARRVVSRALGREVTDAEVSRHFYVRALAWWRDRPGDALALFGRKLAYVVNEAELTLNNAFRYYQREVRTPLAGLLVGPWLLVPLTGLGLVWGHHAVRQRAPGHEAAWWALVASIPIGIVSVAVFFVAGRYRLPLLVGWAVSGGVGVAGLAARASSGRHAVSWLAPVLVVVTLGAVASWPWGLDEGVHAERETWAVHLVEQGHLDEASAHVEKAAAAHPEPARLYLRVGRALQARGEWARALGMLDRAADAAPEQEAIALALGETLVALGRHEDALEALRVAGESVVRPDAAAALRARALLSLGRLDEAALVVARFTAVKDATSPRLGEMAEAAIAASRPADAVRFLRELAAREPSNVDIVERFGVAQSLAGDDGAAAGTLEAGVARWPDRTSLHLNLAIVYAKQGRLDEARTAAERALALDPGYERARALMRAIK